MRLIATAPQQLQWEPLHLPQPSTGEVGVTTRYSSVSISSELSMVRDGPFPRKLGYQTLGVVEAVGPDVALSVGQRVVTMLGHASAGVHRAHRVFAVPDHISDKVALCLILGEETLKGIRKVVPRPSERVLVAGAGLLGLLTVFNLTRRGIEKVSVLEPDTERHALARAFGAQAYAPGVLPHDQFDVGFECSATPAGFAELLNHLRPAGRACVLSDGNWGRLILPPEFHTRELSVVASSDGEDYHAYAAWLWQHGDPVLERLFQETVSASELPATFERLREYPRPVSVLVEW